MKDGLGQAVNFIQLDCLASEARQIVALGTALTVQANGCYRRLGKQLRGFEKASPKQWYRRFVETGGLVEVAEGRNVVRLACSPGSNLGSGTVRHFAAGKSLCRPRVSRR